MRTREILTAFVLAGLVVGAPASAAPAKSDAAPAAAAAILRTAVSVDGPVIRLGDLFLNAGEKAHVAVAHAPAPGKKQVFDVRTLYRLARAHGLAWRPLGRADQAVVERESTVVGVDEIEAQIKAVLVEKGLDPQADVEIGNRMLRLHLPTDAAAGPAVEDSTYDPSTRRFTAVIATPADGGSTQRLRVTGRTLQMTEVPVLTRRLLAGETIGKSDIEWIKVASDRLQSDAIVAAEDLVGKAAKHGLRAGVPVRTTEVRRPILVEKGNLVTVVLKRRQMLLTAQGRALDSGSEGETVRIANTLSKAVIEGEVTGVNTVAVRPLGAVVTQ